MIDFYYFLPIQRLLFLRKLFVLPYFQQVDMKKILLSILLFSRIALGQSVTISPTNTEELLIEKANGTAVLSLKGSSSLLPNSNNGNAEIQLHSQAKALSSSENSINFFQTNTPIFSIKHNYSLSNPSYQNKFAIYHIGNPIFQITDSNEPYIIKTIAQSLSSSSTDQVSLENPDVLGNNVTASLKYKIGDYYTGAIKTIGNDASTARLSFFTGSNSNYASLQERFSILNNGKVGIGTNTVSTNELLEVNGRMRLRRNAFASGLWLNNSANGTALTDGAFVGLNNESPGTESAGFWLNGAFRWFVDRAGNTTQNSITATNLAGVAGANVYADANGKLSASPIHHVITIPPSSFQPRYNNSGTFTAMGTFGGCYMSNGSNSEIVASVILPAGALVTNVKVTYVNTDNTRRFTMFLNYSDQTLALTNFHILFDGTTTLVSSGETDFKTINLDQVTVNPIIEGDFPYFIRIVPETTGGVASTWSNTGNFMNIKSVKITYVN